MTMANYNEQLNCLFDGKEEYKGHGWIDKYGPDGYLFCRDGLLKKYDNVGNEINNLADELWAKAKRRVVFMLKDKNTPGQQAWGEDIREWLKYESNRELSGQNMRTGFLPNLAGMLYGILNTRTDTGKLSYGTDIDNNPDVAKTWREQPFAFVETKKLAGGNTVSPNIIMSYLKEDSQFIKEELAILRPNIIVCCYGNDLLYEKFVSLLSVNTGSVQTKEYPYLINDRTVAKCKWCYYTDPDRLYSDNGFVIINSFHPTKSPQKQNWLIVERVLSTFNSFVMEHPEF